MTRPLLTALTLAALVLAGGGQLKAQTPALASDSAEFANWKGIARWDAEQLREKIMGLARAIPADRLGWRPMDGTRSFHDVFAHIAAEGFLEPVAFGLPRPAGSLAGFEAEEARLQALPDDELLPAMQRALDNFVAMVAGLSQDRERVPMRFFGTSTYMRGALALGLYDLHEHLGQLVAYARMNGIVPPWSRGG